MTEAINSNRISILCRLQYKETGASGSTVEFDLSNASQFSCGFIFGVYRAATTDSKDGYCVIKKNNNNIIICAKQGLSTVTSITYNSTTSKLTVTCGAYMSIGLVF